MEASESLEQDATASSTQVRTRPRTLKPTVKRIRLEFTRVGNRKCDYTDLKTKTKTGLIRNLLMLEIERLHRFKHRINQKFADVGNRKKNDANYIPYCFC